MLKSLSIEQYKGFFEKETILFAEPNTKNGSGLTLLVGPQIILEKQLSLRLY